MNDFTKEELEDIQTCIYTVTASSRISKMTYGELEEKIQFLIDNYCEHEEICGNCRVPRNGKYMDSFSDNGHWTDGGSFCGRWIK